jgi:hypothetical protein
VRNPAFGKLLEEIKTLHDSKNHDYATNSDPLSNLRRCEQMGVPALTGTLVRLTDKWSRIEQLMAGKIPKHESLRDSLLDNAVYSLLAILLLDEQSAKPGLPASSVVSYQSLEPVARTWTTGTDNGEPGNTTIPACVGIADTGT